MAARPLIAKRVSRAPWILTLKESAYKQHVILLQLEVIDYHLTPLVVDTGVTAYH
jgi:hypothetical protein